MDNNWQILVIGFVFGLTVGFIGGNAYGTKYGTEYGWVTYPNGKVECTKVFERTECILKEE